MAQWLRFGLYLAFVPVYAPVALAMTAYEAVTGEEVDMGDGVQHSPDGPVRPAGGHRRGALGPCPCGRTHQ